MRDGKLSFTPFEDVNEILGVLLQEIRGVLTDQLVGMYLHGSLAIGDFNPDTSDIDFLVVTGNKISEQCMASLMAMHSRIASIDSTWSSELEGSYIPRDAVRRYNPADCHHPRLERGETLRIESHDSDWVIQRHIIYHHGVVIAGPPPKDLIDPVLPDDVRQAVLDLLWWWELQLADTSLIQVSGYRTYAILTMCRILYTLEHGTIVTKPTAAHWAEDTLGERWSDLIGKALRWRSGKSMAGLDEVMAFIQFTLDQAGHTGKASVGGNISVDSEVGQG